MPTGFGVGLSGYQVASQRLQVSANNIANSTTTVQFDQNGTPSNEPFRPQTVQPVTQADGGVTSVTLERQDATVQRFEPNSAVADEEGFVVAPNVNVAEELVNQAVARNAAVANLRSIEVQDELLEETIDAFSDTPGSTLDIFA